MTGLFNLTYEDAKVMPIGTIVADGEGYWLSLRRKYVKTSENTWALFFGAVMREDVEVALSEKRNNLSPCPTGLVYLERAL